ncbi:NUDIX domain-containing protein [Massilia aerilata]|uniref:NUDIX domain-containing protein n=1 Tax=Massilia aerilata TaxID=453817 RepID=A0ABW0RZI3_9BURK
MAELGEAPKECVEREISEELNLPVNADELLDTDLSSTPVGVFRNL